MQSSLPYWWLSHFVAFLASVPWPGCSLIYNQNIKSIVLPGGRGGCDQFNKADIVPRVGNHLATDKEFQDAEIRQAVQVHTHRVKYFTRCFWYSSMAKRLRLKCLSYHRNWLGTSFPVTLSTPSWSSPLKPLQEGVTLQQAGRQWRKTSSQLDWALDSSLTFQIRPAQWQLTFKIMFTLLKATFQTHSFLEGKQLLVQPCLCSSRFDRKTTSICFKIISICWKLFLRGSPPR